MIKEILKVAEFMSLMNQETHLAPVMSVTKEDALLREKLISEEVYEMKDGHTSEDSLTYRVDPAIVLDSLTDQFYVWAGTVLHYGLANYLPRAFRIVHESNMSKLWTHEQVEHLIKQNKGYVPKGTKIEGSGSRYVLKCNGKVMKPPTYIDALPQLKEMMEEVVSGQDMLDFDKPKANFDKFVEEPTVGGDVCNPCTCGSNSIWCAEHATGCDASVPF